MHSKKKLLSLGITQPIRRQDRQPQDEIKEALEITNETDTNDKPTPSEELLISYYPQQSEDY